MKVSIQNFFEDFRIGTRFRCPTPRVLTDADRVAYIALTGDRSPLYCSSAGSVHPLIVFHTVLGQTVRQISLNAVANLGYADLRWQRPVTVGDQIRTEAEIIGLKENSNRKAGICYVRTTGLNQRGETVLSYIRWVMVRKRSETETPFLAEPEVPDLPSSVRPEALQVPVPPALTADETGGRFWFEDYEAGERVDHVDGMTINQSDHMTFTRLYQNSARVHFDAVATAGKPLVYGGLPISIGYAQTYNGFENRFGICAMNGGSHSNPVFAGDTLYSQTTVLETHRLDRCGALRLRLIVVKNERPGPGFSPTVTDAAGGRMHYDPSVVLDLDYWELMPYGRT